MSGDMSAGTQGHELEERNVSRRDFLMKAGRWALAALLGGGIGGLIKAGRLNHDAETCTNQGICRHCNLADMCRLPQALSYRQATGKERKNG